MRLVTTAIQKQEKMRKQEYEGRKDPDSIAMVERMSKRKGSSEDVEIESGWDGAEMK